MGSPSAGTAWDFKRKSRIEQASRAERRIAPTGCTARAVAEFPSPVVGSKRASSVPSEMSLATSTSSAPAITLHRIPVTLHRVRCHLASAFEQSEHRSATPELRSAAPGNVFLSPCSVFFEPGLISRRLASRSADLETRSWARKRVINCLAPRSGGPCIAFATLKHRLATLASRRVSLCHRPVSIKHRAGSLRLASAAIKHGGANG